MEWAKQDDEGKLRLILRRVEVTGQGNHTGLDLANGGGI